ncbi:MAG: hypothetical protein Q7O66_15040 [Dehalococcoidia bacterium]|nr:hypothetical protein [Dehalococcoidia bacterium]
MTDDLRRGLSDGVILAVNRLWADFALRSKGRVVALAGIEPWRKAAPELFRRCVEEYGMRALKWHPDYGHYSNCEEAYEVVKMAEQLETPLLTPLDHCRDSMQALFGARSMRT